MISNSTHTYGAITKMFHWLTALLILTMIPLGIVASRLPYGSAQELTLKAWVFSAHKTLGITILLIAILRILWALIQPKPGALNAKKPLESWLASTVHWLLYASLILVPLTGWIHHSATTGFAPIWPPVSNLVGQSLPLIPKSDSLAHLFGTFHIVFERILVAAILLHVAGALKHHFIDKDITLKRMLPGHTAPDILPEQTQSHRMPIVAAITVYVAALGIAGALGMFAQSHTETTAPKLARVTSDWIVREGTLGLTVRQLGSDVTGEFADWTAAIEFSETSNANGLHGAVDVEIAIGSLTLGSVTTQALGADFFAADTFPIASFAAPITSTDGRYAANGTLTIKGVSAPVNLPFTLQIIGDTAVMQGQATLNRTSFKIGESYADETSVGFDVLIDVSLTATRNN